MPAGLGRAERFSFLQNLPYATYQTIIGRVRQGIEFKDVDLAEVEKKKTVALRKSEEIERQREGKVLAPGNGEVAELIMITV
ncbi:MAG: hypothetical protein L6R36_006578 [Xanthoria steineri]|nr:MAG: hypothetical protein L6R36_006578 [Xanthoria steineri]